MAARCVAQSGSCQSLTIAIAWYAVGNIPSMLGLRMRFGECSLPALYRSSRSTFTFAVRVHYTSRTTPQGVA